MHRIRSELLNDEHRNTAEFGVHSATWSPRRSSASRDGLQALLQSGRARLSASLTEVRDRNQIDVQPWRDFQLHGARLIRRARAGGL